MDVDGYIHYSCENFTYIMSINKGRMTTLNGSQIHFARNSLLSWKRDLKSRSNCLAILGIEIEAIHLKSFMNPFNEPCMNFNIY